MFHNTLTDKMSANSPRKKNNNYVSYNIYELLHMERTYRHVDAISELKCPTEYRVLVDLLHMKQSLKVVKVKPVQTCN